MDRWFGGQGGSCRSELSLRVSSLPFLSIWTTEKFFLSYPKPHKSTQKAPTFFIIPTTTTTSNKQLQQIKQEKQRKKRKKEEEGKQSIKKMGNITSTFSLCLLETNFYAHTHIIWLTQACIYQPKMSKFFFFFPVSSAHRTQDTQYIIQSTNTRAHSHDEPRTHGQTIINTQTQPSS